MKITISIEIDECTKSIKINPVTVNPVCHNFKGYGQGSLTESCKPSTEFCSVCLQQDCKVRLIS